ncbi:MAG: FAD-binding oxidoreductase [bacterium]|nr:FAD-binding oxidoreductase [bacterium]
MNKIAHYLQEHLVGEVLSDKDTLERFSTDKSIFHIEPMFVVFPEDESDIRKTVRFAWQLADRGRSISVTPRGNGYDETGAAIGNGMVVDFSSHMTNILGLDPKTGDVKVQPGVNFDTLQQALRLHGRYIPSVPNDSKQTSVGGAVGNNSSGRLSFKYGAIKYYTKGLKVVLSNGDVIETSRLSKKQFNKKMGEGGLEAKIYREVDKLIEENQELLVTLPRSVSRNSAGYDLLSVKLPDGSFDLTPLFVGSQGTLGIISEITFATIQLPEETSLIVAKINNIEDAQEMVLELALDEERPCSMEMIDENLLRYVHEKFPNYLNSYEPPFPKMTVLIELDDAQRTRKKIQKKVERFLSKKKIEFDEVDAEEKQMYLKLLQLPNLYKQDRSSKSVALPIVNDGIVPVGRTFDYINMLNELFVANNVEATVWGSLGDGYVHFQPRLDLSEVVDRQKVFRIMDVYYDAVLAMGGSISGSGGDGRLKAPFLQAMYKDAYVLFEKIKNIFDPKDIMNTGVKTGVDTNDNKSKLRKEYSLKNSEYLHE